MCFLPIYLFTYLLFNVDTDMPNECLRPRAGMSQARALKSSKHSLRLWPRQWAGINSYHERQRCSDMRLNCDTNVVKWRNVKKNDHPGAYPARSIAISSVATCHAKGLQHEVLRSKKSSLGAFYIINYKCPVPETEKGKVAKPIRSFKTSGEEKPFARFEDPIFGTSRKVVQHSWPCSWKATKRR